MTLLASSIVAGLNPVIVGVLLGAGLVGLAAELVGVFRHGDHKIDTYSELYWSVRNRVGPFRLPLALGLAVFFGWLWVHFTFQGPKK